MRATPGPRIRKENSANVAEVSAKEKEIVAENSANVAEVSAREKEIVAENSANVAEVSAKEKEMWLRFHQSFGGCEFDKQT